MDSKKPKWASLQQLAWCLAAGSLLLPSSATLTRAQNLDDSFQSYLAQEPQKRASEAVAREFINAAVAGDLPTLRRLVGGPVADRVGPEGVDRYLRDVVVPFFASHSTIGRSITITGAVDENGNRGFSFYMYSVQNNNEQRPFVIYVVDYKGEKKVPNVAVNHFEGRHRPDEQGSLSEPPSGRAPTLTE